jgi:hypothetical protein
MVYWLAGVVVAIVAAATFSFNVWPGFGTSTDAPEDDSIPLGPGQEISWPDSDRLSGAQPNSSTNSQSGLIEFQNGAYDADVVGFVEATFVGPDGTCFAAPDLTRTAAFVLPLGPGYRVTVKDLSPSYVSLELQTDAGSGAPEAPECG